MADTKISALPSAATVAGTEVLPIVQAGNTVKATVAGLGVGITQLGTLGSLAVAGNVTVTGTVSGATSVSATALAGTLSTAAQPNVTSLGTLSSLVVGGSLTVDSGTLAVDAANNRVGVGTTSPLGSLSVQSVNGSVGFNFGTPVSPQRGNLWYDTDGTGWHLSVGKVQSGTFTEQMRLNDTGNLGLRTTPSAWAATYPALDIGIGASFVGRTDIAAAWMASNWVQESGSQKYKNTGAATTYLQNAGAHSWWNAPSGSAGAVVTLTQAMTLDASGNLGVGIASPLSRLHVSGADAVRIALINGATRAVRIGADATAAYVEGVDQTGVGSYQPLYVGGSIIAMFTGGTERARVKAEGQVRFVPLAAAPATNVENGDVYYDSTTNKLRVRAAGAWVDLH